MLAVGSEVGSLQYLPELLDVCEGHAYPVDANRCQGFRDIDQERHLQALPSYCKPVANDYHAPLLHAEYGYGASRSSIRGLKSWSRACLIVDAVRLVVSPIPRFLVGCFTRILPPRRRGVFHAWLAGNAVKTVLPGYAFATNTRTRGKAHEY